MMREMMTSAYTYNNVKFDFGFRTNLTASEKITFVNSVTNTLVDDNYNSIIKDLIFDYMIVQLFTDVDTSAIYGIDMIEKFLNETDIVNTVKENVKGGLIEDLNKAVDLNIEYRLHTKTNPLNEALTSLINTVEKKVNDIDLEGMMEMANVFAGMTDELTPENIVKAYMDSDIHKNNLKEIEESKKRRTELAEDIDKVINDKKVN